MTSELPYGRVSQSCGAAAVGVAECSISRAAVAPAARVRVLSVRPVLSVFILLSCRAGPRCVVPASRPRSVLASVRCVSLPTVSARRARCLATSSGRVLCVLSPLPRSPRRCVSPPSSSVRCRGPCRLGGRSSVAWPVCVWSRRSSARGSRVAPGWPRSAVRVLFSSDCGNGPSSARHRSSVPSVALRFLPTRRRWRRSCRRRRRSRRTVRLRPCAAPLAVRPRRRCGSLRCWLLGRSPLHVPHYFLPRRSLSVQVESYSSPSDRP